MTLTRCKRCRCVREIPAGLVTCDRCRVGLGAIGRRRREFLREHMRCTRCKVRVEEGVWCPACREWACDKRAAIKAAAVR